MNDGAGIFDNKGSKTLKRTMDTRTGETYASRNQCYQAIAPSEGMDTSKTLGWYDLCRKYPLRFEDVETGRKIDKDGRLA